MLITTKVELGVLKDIDMLLFCERAIRGGINGTGALRHFKANNHYMHDFDPSQPTVFGAFFDVTSLYAGTMQKPLPVFNYKRGEDLTSENILQTDSFGLVGFSLRWTWNILHICMHVTTIHRLLRKNSQSRRNGCRSTPIVSIFQFHQFPSALKYHSINIFTYSTLETFNFIWSKDSGSKNCIVFCSSIKVAGLESIYPKISQVSEVKRVGLPPRKCSLPLPLDHPNQLQFFPDGRYIP